MNKTLEDLKNRFKSMNALEIVIYVLEILTFILLTYLSISLTVKLAQGITFFGEKFKAYEIVVVVLLYILSLTLGVVLYKDTFVRDYEKDRHQSKKVVKNGRIIEVEETEETKEAPVVTEAKDTPSEK